MYIYLKFSLNIFMTHKMISLFSEKLNLVIKYSFIEYRQSVLERHDSFKLYFLHFESIIFSIAFHLILYKHQGLSIIIRMMYSMQCIRKEIKHIFIY